MHAQTSPAVKRWRSVDDMPDDATTWRDHGYEAAADEWKELREQLKHTTRDKTAIETWNRQMRREFAVETGQIENLYIVSPRLTEQLIVHGFEGAKIPHDTVSNLVDKDRVADLLQTQKEALDGIYAAVKKSASLSHAALMEWHTLLTRHQKFSPATNRLGERVEVPLERGVYKTRPNFIRMRGGWIQEFCPPQQVTTALDKLFEMYDAIKQKHYPTSAEAAWLHHRYAKIHPFQDGNGRTARLLMAYSYIRRDEIPPVITMREKETYIDALNDADQGDLKRFADLLSLNATVQTRRAVASAKKVLRGDDRIHHPNGEVSVKDSATGEWTNRPDGDEFEII